MKVSVMFQKKVSGSEPYSSEGFHVSLESEPPPEVASDREKLANYVMALAAEAKARVEEALTNGRIERQEREPAPERPVRVESGNESRRAPPPARGPERVFRRSPQSGNGHLSGQTNGRSAPSGEVASLKQIGYLRSLARERGYTNDQLALFLEEVVGRSCPLNGLLKREASAAIESLKANAA